MTKDLVIGFVYGGALDPEFVRSLLKTTQSIQRLRGVIMQPSPSGMVPSSRNAVVREFLQTDCRWLLWLNTDKEWEPSEVTKILESAEKHNFPILSAHIRNPGEDQTSTRPVMVDGYLQAVEPTSDADFIPCFCAGMGFYLIERKVLEEMQHGFADHHPDEWFAYEVWEEKTVGEDLVFSRRLKQLGYVTRVDQSLKVGHRKTVALYPPQFL